MEILIIIILFGLMIYMLPYIIAGAMLLIGLAAGVIVLVTMVVSKLFKSFLGK